MDVRKGATYKTNTVLLIKDRVFPEGTLVRVEGVTQGGWRLQVVFLSKKEVALEKTTINMDALVPLESDFSLSSNDRELVLSTHGI